MTQYWQLSWFQLMLAISASIGSVFIDSVNIGLAQIRPLSSLAQVPLYRSAANSISRSKTAIPAWLDVTGRWVLIDITELIFSECARHSGKNTSQFIITGRGGFPPGPSDSFRSDAVRVNLEKLIQGQENRTSTAISTNPTVAESAPIVEAQGWVIGSHGEVFLTAKAVPVQPHGSWQRPSGCRMLQRSF